MGPQDPKDVTQNIARDLVEIVSRINMARADATHWLKEPDHEALRLRLEMAHAAAEAALVEANLAASALLLASIHQSAWNRNSPKFAPGFGRWHHA